MRWKMPWAPPCPGRDRAAPAGRSRWQGRRAAGKDPAPWAAQVLRGSRMRQTSWMQEAPAQTAQTITVSAVSRPTGTPCVPGRATNPSRRTPAGRVHRQQAVARPGRGIIRAHTARAPASTTRPPTAPVWRFRHRGTMPRPHRLLLRRDAMRKPPRPRQHRNRDMTAGPAHALRQHSMTIKPVRRRVWKPTGSRPACMCWTTRICPHPGMTVLTRPVPAPRQAGHMTVPVSLPTRQPRLPTTFTQPLAMLPSARDLLPLPERRPVQRQAPKRVFLTYPKRAPAGRAARPSLRRTLRMARP